MATFNRGFNSIAQNQYHDHVNRACIYRIAPEFHKFLVEIVGEQAVSAMPLQVPLELFVPGYTTDPIAQRSLWLIVAGFLFQIVR